MVSKPLGWLQYFRMGLRCDDIAVLPELLPKRVLMFDGPSMKGRVVGKLDAKSRFDMSLKLMHL